MFFKSKEEKAQEKADQALKVWYIETRKQEALDLLIQLESVPYDCLAIDLVNALNSIIKRSSREDLLNGVLIGNFYYLQLVRDEYRILNKETLTEGAIL